MKAAIRIGVGLAMFAAAPGALAQGAAVKAGVAAAVRGKVERAALAPAPSTQGAAIGLVSSGDVIFLGDKITTGPEAGLQIMLMDETVFTIGPNAAMTIDEFVYDPSTGAGKVTARVVQGAFRFVSGKVAKHDPKDMTVRLPQGSIGIRGTAVQGVVEGERATVVLLGPGAENNAGERVGRIVVSNAQGEVLITRPGFMTTFTALTPPSEPARLDTKDAARLGAAMQPPTAAPKDDGASGAPAENGPGAANAGGVVRQSGQGRAAGLRPVGQTAQTNQFIQNNVKAAEQAAQDSTAALSEFTGFDQLRSIHGGTGRFQFASANLVPVVGTGSGHYTMRLDFDFGARKVELTMTGMYTVGALSGTVEPFGGAHVKNYSGDAGALVNKTTDPILLNGGANMVATFTMRNDVNGRTLAQVLEQRVEIYDTGRNNVIATEGGSKSATRQ
jgi:hypothetical protein